MDASNGGAYAGDDYYYEGHIDHEYSDGLAGSCDARLGGADIECEDYSNYDEDSRPSATGFDGNLRNCMYWCQCCIFPVNDA